MCVMSMVYDHFEPLFPHPDDSYTSNKIIISPPIVSNPFSISPEIEELRTLIKEFREAVEAARTVDKLTGQADCEDPDKKKLEDRVAKLEKQLKLLSTAKKPAKKKKTVKKTAKK